MELKNQVCNLKLAKKLKELRVKQNSLFYWIVYKNGNIELQLKGKCGFVMGIENIYSTFTVAELGELLKRGAYSIFTHKVGKWLCECIYDMGVDKGDGVITIKAKTEANARAKMLIYLLENKLIKIEKGDEK